MTRIVLTGGAGFLGSHLARSLLDRGDEVVVIDNLITGALRNIADLTDHAGFTFVEADVTAPFNVSGDIDAVLHFASPASPPDFERLAIEIMMVGSIGTQNCLELARAKGARFLLASTSEVYGDPHVHPQTESYAGNSNPVGPRSVYDEAKRYAEALTMAYARSHGVDVRIARIFNMYGPHMRHDDGRAVPNFISKALAGEPLTIYGDGSHTRSFTYVADGVAGLLALLESDVIGPVNIGNPDEYTIRDLVEITLSVTGSSSEIVYQPARVDDPTRRRPDITVARRELGWEPVTDLKLGIEQTVRHVAREQATMLL